jgi:hypothetical protein
MYLLTRWGGQFRVGRTERCGDAPPREMIAQWRLGAMDRMRLIDRPEAFDYLRLDRTPIRGDVRFIDCPEAFDFNTQIFVMPAIVLLA